MAQKYDLQIDQGADFVLALTLTDNSTPPVPINLTGATFAGQIRETYSQVDPALADFTFNVLDAAAGTLEVSLSQAVVDTLPVVPAASVALTPTQFVYDIFMTASGGLVTRVLQGYVCLSPEVTQ